MHRVDFVVPGHLRELERVVFVGLAFNLSRLPCFAARMSDQHLNAKFTSQIHDPPGERTGFEVQQRRFDVKQELFERFRIGHDGFEYRNRRVILGQQTGHGLEFSKIQSENCFHGRESPGSKELKRVYLNILPNSAFGCPTHDLHGFSYTSASHTTPTTVGLQRLRIRRPVIQVPLGAREHDHRLPPPRTPILSPRKQFMKPTRKANAKNRSAIYTRKSVEEDHYDDSGFSGSSLDRPALNRLLDDIKSGKIDCVVVYNVDRLSRSPRDLSRIMEAFDEYGVSFVSVSDEATQR